MRHYKPLVKTFTATNILRTMKRVLKEGWIKHSLVNRNRYCELGALNKVVYGVATGTTGTVEQSKAYHSAYRALTATVKPIKYIRTNAFGERFETVNEHPGLPSFNDAKEIEHKDVLAHLDRAIAFAKTAE